MLPKGCNHFKIFLRFLGLITLSQKTKEKPVRSLHTELAMTGKHSMHQTWAAPGYMPMDLEIAEVVRFQHTTADGSVVVAVTSADFLLSDVDDFILSSGKPKYRSCYQGIEYGNLNKNRLWETFVDELERTCIAKTDRVNMWFHRWETVYTVPIIGHKVFVQKNNNLQQSRVGAVECGACAKVCNLHFVIVAVFCMCVY